MKNLCSLANLCTNLMKFKISCKVITAVWNHTKKWVCGHHRFSLVENFKTFNFCSNDVESVQRSSINLKAAFLSLCQVTESDNQHCKVFFLGDTKKLIGFGPGQAVLDGPSWAGEQHQVISFFNLNHSVDKHLWKNIITSYTPSAWF